jgi:MurNAc alpha-1-phosphate uridylyltransferase
MLGTAMTWRPHTAFVLAAGLGTRMRPLTDTVPKPMVPLKGRPLIDRVLDRLAAAGIARAVVNLHYLADVLAAHLATRARPAIVLSDERDALLDTGGGVVRAMPLIGGEPFLIHNSDSVWNEGSVSNLARLFAAWDEARMDSLMLLADRATSLGYEGEGDFLLAADGRLARRPRGATAPYVFTGVSIAHPRLMAGAPAGPFSLNRQWDAAIRTGRLHGLLLDGRWMHVGTPAALQEAERLIDD